MGYQITFRPPKEFVDTQLKPKAGSSVMARDIRDLKIEIMMYCMKPDEKAVSNDINRLSYMLRLMYNMIKNDTFAEAVRRFEEDGEIWYCGWNFSHEACEWDLEDSISMQVEDFIILKGLVSTPDWFDEHEKFYEKLNEVKSNISGFEEICEEIAIYEVMDMLREFDISNEPEEIGEISDEDSGGKIEKDSAREIEKAPYYNAEESDPYQIL